MARIWALLLLVGCNHVSGVPLPEAANVDDLYHPSPFPHVEPDGIIGNWIHVTPRGITTMLWTFRPDGSFEMDVFEAQHGYPFQRIPGTFQIDGNQLTLVGPFAGKPRVRMTMELLFNGDEVAAPVFHPLLPVGSAAWQSKMPIDELDENNNVTSSYTRTDTYRFMDDGLVEVKVSTEANVLQDLLPANGSDVYANGAAMDDGGWDLSLGSVPSWNQLELWGDLMAAPPLTRTY